MRLNQSDLDQYIQILSEMRDTARKIAAEGFATVDKLRAQIKEFYDRENDNA